MAKKNDNEDPNTQVEDPDHRTDDSNESSDDDNEEVQEGDIADTSNAPQEPAPGTATGKRTPQPEGQTSAGSAQLGGSDAEFADNVTALPHQRGQAVTEPTRVRKDKKGQSTPDQFETLTKALGLKNSDMLSYNERTRTIVYTNGAKYQISKNGKSLRHHAGPRPPADLNLKLVDATSRGFAGSAAAINSPAVVPDDAEQNLVARREALKAELDAVNAQLEG